ncbi:MAG TPA: lipopolysaccharide heptosyltransferase II [Blastocatellia bacterium]|nr:lipopolysaccharide heptosyltransferase II [Blastocatellia bacterium]
MSDTSQIIKEAIRRPVESFVRVYLSSLPVTVYSPDRVRRILVFAYHGLGNFIMYTPALKLLRERFPDARIDLQVGNNTGCEEVVARSHVFNHIYNLPYNSSPDRWIKRAIEIRETGYDVTINEFHSHSWKLALLVAYSRAPFRVGHVTSPGWSKRFSRYSFVFNMPAVMREREHEIERYLDLLAPLGITRPSITEAQTSVFLTGEDRQYARCFLRQTTAGSYGEIIGIQPGTSPAMRWKQWPLDRYRALICDLLKARPDARIVLFGSPGELAMIEGLVEGLGERVQIAAGRTTVRQVAALIELCDMLVCNDSGLMHVAVAVGTPVVAIYGPTDMERTAPLGENHTVVRHDIACSPCFRLEGDAQVQACSHHDCLMTIYPEEVFNEVTVSLSRQTERKAAIRG